VVDALPEPANQTEGKGVGMSRLAELEAIIERTVPKRPMSPIRFRKATYRSQSREARVGGARYPSKEPPPDNVGIGRDPATLRERDILEPQIMGTFVSQVTYASYRRRQWTLHMG